MALGVNVALELEPPPTLNQSETTDSVRRTSAKRLGNVRAVLAAAKAGATKNASPVLFPYLKRGNVEGSTAKRIVDDVKLS